MGKILVTSNVSFSHMVFYFVRNAFGLPISKQTRLLTTLEKEPNKNNVGKGENAGN